MGCNCKQTKQIKEALGAIPEDETLLEKGLRYLKKLLYFVIGIALAVIVVPVALVVIVYNFAFKGEGYINISHKFIQNSLGINKNG